MIISLLYSSLLMPSLYISFLSLSPLSIFPYARPFLLFFIYLPPFFSFYTFYFTFPESWLDWEVVIDNLGLLPWPKFLTLVYFRALIIIKLTMRRTSLCQLVSKTTTAKDHDSFQTKKHANHFYADSTNMVLNSGVIFISSLSSHSCSLSPSARFRSSIFS
jgi:hypothetical protein